MTLMKEARIRLDRKEKNAKRRGQLRWFRPLKGLTTLERQFL